MTDLDRLAHAVLFPGFVGLEAPGWLLDRARRGLGGVVLFARNVHDPDQLRALTDALRSVAPDLLVSIDEEGGDVTRLHAATGSPDPGHLALGRGDDVALTRAVAAGIAAQLDAAGVDWDLAPDADVNDNPANPVIGVRSFGADPALVSRHVAAYVTGLQERGVIACAKHFPGHGDTSVDSHLGLPSVAADEATLRRVHLAPFASAVAAGVRTVMTGHLLVPALDPDLPATLSHHIVTGVLRERLGFDGVVMSDALEMAGVAATVGLARGAVLALAAGVDALCLGGELADEDVVASAHDAILAAVRDGDLAVERLEEAASRVAELAAWRARHRGRGGERDAAAAATAARRAVTTTGGVFLGEASPVVVTLDPVPTIAVGRVRWGVDDALARRRPGTVALRVTGEPADGGAGLLAEATGRPLVVVVRDPHRHPWQASLLHSLVTARPDLVVVDLGLPSTDPSLARARGVVTTGGASRAGADAAVDVLLATPDPDPEDPS